jgi:hypothetical protein
MYTKNLNDESIIFRHTHIFIYMETKICKTKRDGVIACGLEKTKDEFYKGSSLCKSCSKQLNNLRKEYRIIYRKDYYQKNKDYYKKKGEEYRDTNKEYFVEYRKNNKESINEKIREHYYNNVEKINQKNREWIENNLERHREHNRKSAAKSRKNNPEKHRWRYILKETLKKLNKDKIDKTIVLLGYSPKELKLYLESLSSNWYEYEIDHKIPLTWFITETPVSLVNDFRNLQLLDKSKNSSKRNFYMDDVDENYYNEVKQYIKKEYLKN